MKAEGTAAFLQKDYQSASEIWVKAVSQTNLL